MKAKFHSFSPLHIYSCTLLIIHLNSVQVYVQILLQIENIKLFFYFAVFIHFKF